MKFKKKLLSAVVVFVIANVVNANAFDENSHINSSPNMEPKWGYLLGLGPNFSKMDAVGDDLKSSYGAMISASRVWGERSRLDLSFDYFSFEGSETNYKSLNAAYGWRFFQDRWYSFFALGGLGIGQAAYFPRAIKTSQVVPNLFLRIGLEEIFRWDRLSMGLIWDYFHIELDGNKVRYADLALPMLSLSYRFESDKKDPPSKPKPIAKKIVAIDSDQDGVADQKDECPGTATGTKVNSIGCPPEKRIEKRLRVEFATNSYEVLPAYEKNLREFADYLKENNDLKVTIEGHTDSRGSTVKNIKLSQNRADEIKRRLVSIYGIEENRLKSIGFGPNKPERNNDTKENRQINRRVVVVLN